MRFKPKNCLRENDIIAKDIFSPNGELLLRKGSTLSINFLNRLNDYGITGAFIEDELSEGIEIAEAISVEVKMIAMKNIEKAFEINDNTPKKEVESRMRNLMKSARDIVAEILANSTAVLNLIDIKSYDTYTFAHSVSVATLSTVIGIGMNYMHKDLVELAYSALLHDMGKVFIDEEIINKPGKLTDEEFAVVKSHPSEGFEYLKKTFHSSISFVALKGVLDHHEKYDGSGYPNGLAGKGITEFGRIIAVADVYDALTSDRPYREAWTSMRAIDLIRESSEKHFDPYIVLAFLKKIALAPVGSFVLITGNLLGIVVENNADDTHRPKVRIVKENGKDVTPYEINLLNESSDIVIESVLKL